MKTGPTARSTVVRHADRAHYDRAEIHGILDAGLVAHVGMVVDGAPIVIPMVYARSGDRIFLHGARASRLQKTLGGGTPVCITVTLLDGIVQLAERVGHLKPADVELETFDGVGVVGALLR